MLHAGVGDPASMLAQFRCSAVLVPRWGADAVLTGDERGIRWIYAFSGEDELVAFARAKGVGGAEVEYLSVFGSRLLDVAVPALGVPGGVALDVAGGRPMLFPPMSGVVPDAVALDGAGMNGGMGS